MVLSSRRTLFRHPLAAVGGALFAAGGVLFMVLLLIEFTSATDNPYRDLVTFVIAPGIILTGFFIFLLSIWLQVRAARKRGESVRFNLSIDTTDAGYMKNLWLFFGLAAVLTIFVIYSGTKAYEATDSVAFCGETGSKFLRAMEGNPPFERARITGRSKPGQALQSPPW